jgi:hypothetical protein
MFSSVCIKLLTCLVQQVGSGFSMKLGVLKVRNKSFGRQFRGNGRRRVTRCDVLVR